MLSCLNAHVLCSSHIVQKLKKNIYKLLIKFPFSCSGIICWGKSNFTFIGKSIKIIKILSKQMIKKYLLIYAEDTHGLRAHIEGGIAKIDMDSLKSKIFIN
tara:strand:- start:2237 stop:2539 length:303 start_codon:yes stop_codon:yes gene_type:complete